MTVYGYACVSTNGQTLMLRSPHSGGYSEKRRVELILAYPGLTFRLSRSQA
jgi:hypothetical protein